MNNEDVYVTYPCVLSHSVVFLGLDYVSHEDILPYNSTDQVPIQHELFERFLMFNPSKGNQPVLHCPYSKSVLISSEVCCSNCTQICSHIFCDVYIMICLSVYIV